jgi:release factor glutamine methyltransferase
MTIEQILKQFPEAESELLLGHVLKQSKEFLYAHPDRNLTKSQKLKFRKLLKARQVGWPIAYLLGYKDFYGLRFKVTRSTLIPRPESEWLVDKALKILGSQRYRAARLNSNNKILDIGTGSGCLAIAIKKNCPRVDLTAIDISQKALTVTKQNAKAHKVAIKFKKQNLLQGDKTKYDLIIANLPYVPKKDYLKLQDNLRFEPKSALVDSRQDFWLYEQLLKSVPDHLSERGQLLLEIDPSMKPLLEKFCKKNIPEAKLIFTNDLHKLWRFCQIKF